MSGRPFLQIPGPKNVPDRLLPLADEYGNLLSCVRCGLCLTSCPTYILAGHEAEGPRGRIAMMRGLVEGRLELTPDVVLHEQSCLVCDACTAVCPSDVHMSYLQVAVRAQIDAQVRRPLRQRALRHLVFHYLFSDLRRFRLLVRGLGLYQRLGLRWAARRSGILRLLRLAEIEAFLPDLPRGGFVVPRGEWYPADHKTNAASAGDDRQAALFAGCIMSTALAQIDRATIRVLQRAGWSVCNPTGQGCCGALQAHGGDRSEAILLAKRNIEAFERAGNQPIAVNSAGCGAMLKEYAHYLSGDPEWAARARAFSARVRDVTEILVPGDLPIRRAWEGRVTYQDPCHLVHAQRVHNQPRTLLRAIPGLELREMAETGLCCGSAGIYNITAPRTSRQLRERKLDHAVGTGATTLVTANPGCYLQLRRGLIERESTVRVKHIMEVLDEVTAPEVSEEHMEGPMRTSALARDLRGLLVSSQIVDEPGELATFAYDASFMTQLTPQSPEVAVIAGSVDDVRSLLHYASEHRVPVTPRGAASGQAAGSVALRGGVVLALNALNRLLEIDTANSQAFCQPGVVHAMLNEQLSPHRLTFPPDPGSSRMATLGGMASTNAHGMRAVKYGPTGAWVLGLDVVLPDGNLIETGSIGSRAKQSSAGLELTKLFVGAEGTLGVITGLRLKLMPIPPARAIVLALFDVLEHTGLAVQAVFGAGVSPSAIEILDRRCVQAVNLYRPAMQLPDVEALLLFEVDGNPAGVRWDAETISELVRPMARAVEWSAEPQRVAALWEARSLVGAAISTLRPGSNRAYCGEDICVPIARIPETLRAIQDISASHGITIATYGHIGGGNLHPGHLIDAQNPDEIRRVLRVADAIHTLALRMGGTTTGEHGVGAVRVPYMIREHGPALAAMLRLKQALDPHGIMNPGKIFPEDGPLPAAVPAGASPGKHA